jgi:NADPH:quinone reductase-like Zn-dependent oxidoreductase
MKAVVDRVLPLEKAAEAHVYMAANDGFGKVVLTT